MMTVGQLDIKLKEYLLTLLDKIAKDNPIISFARPLINRAINKNFSKVNKMLDLISDDDGNIDVETIITEMAESVMDTKPFTVNTEFLGNIEIGGGIIKLLIPMTNKNLVFNSDDILILKEALLSKV